MRTNPLPLFKLALLCALVAVAAAAAVACEPVDQDDKADAADTSAATDTNGARDTGGQTVEDIPTRPGEDVPTRPGEDVPTATDTQADEGDTATPPTFSAHIQAVYWVDPPAGDSTSPPMLAVEVVGLPFDRVATARVTVEGTAGDADTPLSASASGAEAAEVYRVGGGMGWSAPLDGEATLTLIDATGAPLITLSGQGAADGSARFNTPQGSTLLPSRTQTHMGPRQVWTAEGLVPTDGAPTWDVMFSVRAPANDITPALSDATAWAIRVNAQQPCASRVGCEEPIFATVRHGAALSPTPFSRFLIPLPDALGVEGDRAQVNISLDAGLDAPIAARGIVIALNNTKEKQPDNDIAALAGTPITGTPGATLHLLPIPAPATSDSLPAAGVETALVVAVRDWNIIDGTWHAGPASVRLSDAASDEWAHWPDIPAHSLQAVTDVVVTVNGDPTGFVYRLEVGDDPTALGDLSLIAGEATARCDTTDLTARGYGVCARWTEDAGRWVLSVTAFAPDPSALPAAAPARLYAVDARNGTGPSPTVEGYDLSFDPEPAAVFSVTAALQASENPIYAPNASAWTNTLHAACTFTTSTGTTTGTASAAFVLSGPSLTLAPAAQSSDISANNALVGGAIYPRQTTSTEGDTTFTAPPLVILRTTPAQKSNGKGTRNVATTNTGKPGLL